MTHTSMIKRPLFIVFAFLVVFVLMGFWGYQFGFLGFIYNIMVPDALNQFPLIILAMIFGTAAFFSPCAFSVLPAYVSHYLAEDTQGEKRAWRKGLSLGCIAALGVMTINGFVGLIIAWLGSAAPFAKDPRDDIAIILGIRTAAGFLIAVMGILTVLNKPLPGLSFVHQLIAKANFRKSIFLYGLLYNGAAIGCTGPILLGLTLYALSRGNFASAFTVFVVFAITMGIWMLLLTTMMAVSKEKILQKLTPLTPSVKKAAGWIMVFVGLTIALLTLEGNHLFVKIFFPFLSS